MNFYPIQQALPATPFHEEASANQALNNSNRAPSNELRDAFQQFVGETFFGQMLQALHKTVEKPAYFHGGRTEEVFQAQLDQVLADEMTEKTADTFAGPMFDLYNLSRPH